jgi:hypothetical protein
VALDRFSNNLARLHVDVACQSKLEGSQAVLEPAWFFSPPMAVSVRFAER